MAFYVPQFLTLKPINRSADARGVQSFKNVSILHDIKNKAKEKLIIII
jgi:hypothetical protein